MNAESTNNYIRGCRSRICYLRLTHVFHGKLRGDIPKSTIAKIYTIEIRIDSYRKKAGSRLALSELDFNHLFHEKNRFIINV